LRLGDLTPRYQHYQTSLSRLQAFASLCKPLQALGLPRQLTATEPGILVEYEASMTRRLAGASNVIRLTFTKTN
jgi:hypothetical protein